MQTGTKISGAAHVGLILVALFGGRFTSEPLPFEVAEVSVISAEEYAALTAPRDVPEVAETPQVPDVPADTGGAPDVAPEPEPQPEQAAPETAPAPEPDIQPEPPAEPPLPEVVETPQPEQSQPEVVESPAQPETPPAPPRIERVAPEVVEAPPPDTRPDDVATPEVVPDEGAETPQEVQEATAPEAATDRITPDPPQVAALAPAQSVRPPARRPERPAVTPAAAPAPETAPQPTDTSAAVNDALAEALGGQSEATPAPAGPPLSSGEKEALRVAVSRCWNVGSLSSAALATTVVVAVSMAQDGTPDTGTIRMLSSSGGDAGSAQQAYEAARRAIIRCGASGFDLPAEKYAHWRDIEMTFNPERMRIR